MDMSINKLRQLIQFVFIDLYQFIALRKLHKLGKEDNQTDISAVN
ncbi:hypothetical protein Pan258_45710 [Symmachiella dynata]|nr:hypothetical protein [Symmachiella dynata]QDT50493.1 hypothetical protein Pan258_45710 [Symmachiella dynata]